MEKLNPDTLTHTVTSLISQIVVVPASPLAFISGQVALNEKGELIGEGDYGRQAKQVFTNLQLALDAIATGPENMVQMKIHVVNHTPDLVDSIFKAGFEVFGDRWPLTASTFIGVQALAFQEWLIEVDAIVCISK
ncbi:RidA family protein [Paenibacillus methanolicus]|uniref:Enamine deaminase RidA (YjgF/YER057c/UK114 family) n=1 Tax=Paenibacillus methanolicus TaxID=582686 RepID=A0A5S5C1Q6_9BACL|nr:RidA family protein [Paenibacillus methanolicus]TYP71893.1 enamine deaminase RidA (YjgF/YER057c/UK114 family) [Paenibacillus methanolicus]